MSSIASNYLTAPAGTSSAATLKTKQAKQGSGAEAALESLVTQIAATPKTATTQNAVLGKVSSSQTQVDTQALAASTDATGQSAEDIFTNFTSMSWQDKMRALMLKSMGLTEDDVKNMSPEEQAKLEAKIKEKIDQEIEKKTGISPVQS